jgi:hypothetical protein
MRGRQERQDDWAINSNAPFGYEQRIERRSLGQMVSGFFSYGLGGRSPLAPRAELPADEPGAEQESFSQDGYSGSVPKRLFVGYDADVV